MKRKTDALTLRQGKFLEEYLKCRNGKQAALAAGYAENCAAAIAVKNLTIPAIASKIREVTERNIVKSEVDAAFVIRELKRVAEQEDVAQSTKVRALELIAKHLGMLEDRISLKTDGLTGEQRAERVAILLERVRSRD
jgi:phage terminase small subunit